MTSGLEFEGKNIENAIKKACEKLKVKEEKLKYDVISYGSTGIFGLVGTKKAKIRMAADLTINPLAPERGKRPTPAMRIKEPANKTIFSGYSLKLTVFIW